MVFLVLWGTGEACGCYKKATVLQVEPPFTIKSPFQEKRWLFKTRKKMKRHKSFSSLLRTNHHFPKTFWKICCFREWQMILKFPNFCPFKLWLSSCLKWNWASLGSLHTLLVVEFYQATTSCFATLLHSGPLCSTCQCGFSLPTRPWLQQAYLCWRLSDEQKPIKVFKWMLLFSAHTMGIFYFFSIGSPSKAWPKMTNQEGP